MKRLRRGLVVGKFAPLHFGHEHLIASAQMRCDELTIVSWSRPELPGCAAALRQQWLRQRFPACRQFVIDAAEWQALRKQQRAWPDLPRNADAAATQRRFVGFLCQRVLNFAPDVVFTGEAYGRGFARELGRYLGRDIEHVLIEREDSALAGRAIRRDIHAQRHLLSKEVYASFVRRVCILGGESTGKSTLTEQLAQALGSASVPEYGRELWLARAGVLSRADMRAIAREQIRREEFALRSAVRWLVCDTSPLTTLGYSLWTHGAYDPAIAALATRAYDATLLCAPDFTFRQDGTRRDAAFRAQQHRWYESELARRGIAYRLCTGSIEKRVADALSALHEA